MIPFPDKKYSIIYADPAWSFKNYSKKGEGRNPNQHYKTMSIDDISNLPVSKIADENCILFLWVVNHSLPLAFKVIESWGFEYKTMGFVWVKKNLKSDGFFTGLGYWTRGNPEMCLLATRGRPKRINKDVAQLVVSERRRHSEKPLLHKDIERLVDGPYLEMFARKKHFENWDYWGNEV